MTNERQLMEELYFFMEFIWMISHWKFLCTGLKVNLEPFFRQHLTVLHESIAQ